MFIAIDGIDGCGKSTAAEGVNNQLRDMGYDTLLTKPLGGDKVSQSLRNMLLDPEYKLDMDAHPFLFISDMIHVTSSIIIPALARGKIVISDRYTPSTWVYQIETAEGLSDKQKETLASVLLQWVSVPDITFILDTTVDEALLRLKNVALEYGRPDKYEAASALEVTKRRLAYLDFATSRVGVKHNTDILSTADISVSKENIVNQIIKRLNLK